MAVPSLSLVTLAFLGSQSRLLNTDVCPCHAPPPPPHTHTQTHSLRVPFLASVQKTPGGLVERANWKSLDMVVPGGGERAHLLGAFIDVLRSVEVWRRASQCPTRVGFLLGMKSNSQMNTVSHLVSRHVQLPWIPRMGLCPDARAGDSRDNNGRGGFRG